MKWHIAASIADFKWECNSEDDFQKVLVHEKTHLTESNGEIK